MLEDSQFVMVVRQGRVVLTPAALLDGEKASLLPLQVVGVGFVDGAVILPRGSAHGGIAVAVEAAEMRDRTGAAVGEPEQVIGQG